MPSQKISAGLPRPLRVGMRGPNVRTVERELKELGLLKGPADGFFDAKTKAAVQRYERAQGWKADGVVGDRLFRKLTGGGAQGDAPAGKDSFNFRTVSINVKSNPEMSQDKVLHDVRKAARAGSLIGWNEIGPKRYADAIRGLGKDWGHYFPKHGNYQIPNPISWKKSIWEKKDEGFMKTHGGLAKVSPSRYITWVELEHKKSGQRVVRLNTHLVSGAWSSPKPTTEWRRAQWNTHMKKLDALVEKFEKQGKVVIVGGDFNRDSHRVLGKDVRYASGLHTPTHGNRTLDYIMHTPHEDLRKLGARSEGGYRSDHDAVIVKYQLKK